jgi:urease accessory protein
MLRAVAVATRGHWPHDAAGGTVTLDYDERHRRRIVLPADDGSSFVLDLAETVVLHEGDGLQLEDGSWLAVHAADEDLVEISSHDPGDLARFAWHLGNRHLPADLNAARILIRDDHVIVAMLQHLGAVVRRVRAPFNPERGAYDGAHAHHHEHAHGDDHGHV